MTFDQGQFNFDANAGEEGYRRWREELDERKRAFESRWGIILGTKVLLQLRSHLRPITGIITLIEEKSAAKPRQPHLRIGSIDFCPNEIESIMRIDGNP